MLIRAEEKYGDEKQKMEKEISLEKLKKYAKENGYSVELLDRGIGFKRTQSADRFEIWLEGHNFQSKIAYQPTLQGAINKAYPRIKERIENPHFKPGKFNEQIKNL